MRPLQITLVVIGLFQLVLGVLFVAAPAFAASLFDLTPAAPDWANWLFAMMGARFGGFAYGMFLAARDPRRHIGWIDAMIGIQVIDWIATIAALAAGSVTIGQVTTASFMPVVFVVALVWFHPRRHPTTAAPSV